MNTGHQGARGGRDGDRRAFEALAASASTVLSNRAQCGLVVSLEAFRPARLGAVAALAQPFDRAVSVRTEGTQRTTILLSRPLAFALLALRFGGRGREAAEPLPERPYTAIEERALERTALELWRAVGGVSGRRPGRAIESEGLLEVDDLRARAGESVVLADFRVEGLRADARFWIAVGRDEAPEGERDEDEAMHSVAPARRDAPAPDAPGREAEAPAESLKLQKGDRVTVDLSSSAGAALLLGGRVVARGIARFADTRLVLEIEEVGDDGAASL